MSHMLVDPTDTTTGPALSGPDRGASPVRGRRPRRWALAGAVAVALGVALWLVPPVALTQAGDVTFDDGAVNRTIEEFDARGMYTLRYVHGDEAEVRIPVRNDGWLPATVTGVAFDGRPAPMIVPSGTAGTPVDLAPGETATVAIRVRFDNCEYYTERAVDLYRAVAVTTSTFGLARTHDVVLDHDLAVRSAVMTTCPDRVSDRGAFLRGG
ncbi:MAG: hypothetical protein KY461_02435 [Actinobacteria bacterium]|nr:hypothetical protein [Actinomycetota bacterium]